MADIFEQKKNSVVVKCGLIGDSQIGKTSLMVKYVEGRFDEVCVCGFLMYMTYRTILKRWELILWRK